MNLPYVILTESSCDLTALQAADAGLEIVPLTFTMEGRTYAHYLDGREYPIDRFYEKMRAGVSAVTAAANGTELSEAMEQHLLEGKDVLFLSFSSGLSSTGSACVMAAAGLRTHYPNRKIFTVDTLAACGGQGLLAWLVGKRRLDGASIEEARNYAEEIKLHLAHWFTVDDLAALKRGGRISPAVAAVGTMLNIKPVLHVDNEGHLIPAEKVRGRRAAIQALLRHMEDTVTEPEKQTILITHADCREDAECLRKMAEEHFHPHAIMISEVGPVVGTHTGPGMLSIFFLATHR